MNPLKSAHKPQQRELLAHDASKWYRYHKVHHHKKSINKKDNLSPQKRHKKEQNRRENTAMKNKRDL